MDAVTWWMGPDPDRGQEDSTAAARHPDKLGQHPAKILHEVEGLSAEHQIKAVAPERKTGGIRLDFHTPVPVQIQPDIAGRPAVEERAIGLVFAPHVEHVDSDLAVEGGGLAGQAVRDLVQHQIVVLPEPGSRNSPDNSDRLPLLVTMWPTRCRWHDHLSPISVAAPARPRFPDQAAWTKPCTSPRAKAQLVSTSWRRPSTIAPPRSRPASQRFRAIRAAM